MARIIAIGIEAGDQTPPALEAIEQAIVDDIGIVNARKIVGQWLLLATTPKSERATAARMLEESLARRNPGSRGRNTSSSASA